MDSAANPQLSGTCRDKNRNRNVSGAMDDDQKMVDRVARQFVNQYGKRAPDVLREHADVAATQGNGLSAETWLDIAEAAERLLSG